MRQPGNDTSLLLGPVDVRAWPEANTYTSRDRDAAFAEFEQRRAVLIGELEALEPERLARVGVRADGSEISVLGHVSPPVAFTGLNPLLRLP